MEAEKRVQEPRGARRDAWRRMPRQKTSAGRRRVPWALVNGYDVEPKYRPAVERSRYDGAALRVIRADGKHR